MLDTVQCSTNVCDHAVMRGRLAENTTNFAPVELEARMLLCIFLPRGIGG
jgi:hypothetical protein